MKCHNYLILLTPFQVQVWVIFPTRPVNTVSKLPIKNALVMEHVVYCLLCIVLVGSDRIK